MADRLDILAGRRVLIGVTGGIAAYKVAMLTSALVQRGAEVRVIMTEAATHFVGPLTFQSLTSQPVYLDMWQATANFHSAHISLGDWAEVCVIAPATANIIAKIAGGLADDLLSTTVLALDCPLLIAPAMNVRMWQKPATQDNVAKLEGWGCRFVGPGAGRLACGTTGEGRMSEPAEILKAIEDILAEKPARAAAKAAKNKKAVSKASPHGRRQRQRP